MGTGTATPRRLRRRLPGPAGPWWKPSSAKPLSLQWGPGGLPISLGDPVQMGLRSIGGATLPLGTSTTSTARLNSKATVDALHAMGKKVICYIDAGSTRL